MALILVFVVFVLLIFFGGFWAGAKWMKYDLKKRGKIRRKKRDRSENED